jgi:hypothetical protein
LLRLVLNPAVDEPRAETPIGGILV